MTDTVFLTEALSRRYPEVYWPVRINCESHGIKVVTIRNTRNVWLRDFFPIQIDNGELIRFQYDRKWEQWPVLKIDNEPWTGMFDKPIRESSIILDGGNVVQGPGRVILTDMVVWNNGPEVVAKLEKLFDAEIIIIPCEPGDTLGHADGIVKIFDGKTVLINDYGTDEKLKHYSDELTELFSKKGMNVERIPCGYGDWNWQMDEDQFRKVCPEGDEWNPAFGYYINMLQVENLILMPAMKIPKDAEAMTVLKRLYPHQSIVAVDCSKLSIGGGLLHCVTANYTSQS